MDEPYDLSLPAEVVEQNLADAMRVIGMAGFRGENVGLEPWAQFNHWVGHPNLPVRVLEQHLRMGTLAAWLTPLSPLMMLADPSLLEGLKKAVWTVVYLTLDSSLSKLWELHPEAMQQALPPSRDHREL
jgi:hypothetical protein